jgi:hypothetical protein
MADDEDKGTGSAVPMREHYQIYPGTPLPEFGSSTAQAFLATDKRAAGKHYFALVVRPGIPVRINVLRALKAADEPGLMHLVEWGAIEWPPAKRKLMVIIYERPMGGRVMTELGAEIRRIPDGDIIRKVITPIVTALKKFAVHGLTHRSIRPTNMFWATPEQDRVVLGDCAAAPHALDQPPIFETIESGMSMPTGRGAGTAANDLYSLGASLVVLLSGRAPHAAADVREIIRLKLTQGSYSALIGDNRMPIQVIELLRGLLHDDGDERWDLDSLEQWLGGRRMSPLQTRVDKLASRSFSFNGKEYSTGRQLAIAFAADWDAAIPVAMDGRLELWVRRSLDAADLATALAVAVQGAQYGPSDARIGNDLMMTKICALLDPRAPLRYKGLSFMPDGFGAMLAMTVAEGGEVRLMVEALGREVSRAWMDTRSAYNPDNASIDHKLRAQKTFIERAAIGNGIERVLYELNESLPCQSPYVIEDYVVELRDLLPALNAVAKKSEGGASPVDRHVAAFLMARANFEIERSVSEIADPSAERSALATLNLLANLQWRMSQTGLFGLTSWVGGMMQPAINSYHSRKKRKELEREVPKLVRQGSLVELARLIDNPESRYLDNQGFQEARTEWYNAANEVKELESGRVTRDEKVAVTAQQIASLVSVSIALATLSIVALKRIF